MKKYNLSYSYKTFGGIIGAGVLDVEGDFSIEDVKEESFPMVIRHLREEYDGDFAWNHDFQNLNVSVEALNKEEQ